jgi:hypothetical protein
MIHRLLAAGALLFGALAAAPATADEVAYKTVAVDGLDIFYREAGPADAPIVLLLHGFPSSSHMFRDLIPDLAAQYHVIARTIRASAIPARRRSTSSTTASPSSPT